MDWSRCSNSKFVWRYEGRSALGKVVDVVGYYHMRVKGMTAYFAVSVLIVTGVGVFVHGFDLSH